MPTTQWMIERRRLLQAATSLLAFGACAARAQPRMPIADMHHVAFGTDIEGVGPNWSVNDCAGVRSVLDHLPEMKLPNETVERVAYGNYARVLKAAMR